MKPYYQDEWVTIYHGDCREILPLIPDKSIDLVLTDPPYKREYLYLFGELARYAMPLMKNGSLLLTLTGHFALDQIIKDMTSYLDFYWIGGRLNSLGTVARYHPRQMMMGWKPCLWFSRGVANQHSYVFDTISGKRIDRINHEWEQPLELFEYYINKLTETNDLILDPFLGSGTTAYCAKKLNRKCIGIEIEERYCEIAAKRCSQSVMKLEVKYD